MYNVLDLEKLPPRHYVYVYLDTTRVGVYQYGDYVFKHEPFYVGKGIGRRAIKHIYEVNGNFNRYKINKIKKIMSHTGRIPMIVIIQSDLSDAAAMDLEKSLISLMGRLDIGTGILANMTDGGDGHSGVVQTEATKKKRNLYRKGENNPRFGMRHTDATKAKMKGNTNCLGRIVSEAHRQKVSATNSKRYIVTQPDGVVVEVVNMKRFCKDNGLTRSKMSLVAQGKRTHHKGYSCVFMTTPL